MVARTGAAWLLGSRDLRLPGAAPPRIEPPSSLTRRATTRPYLAPRLSEWSALGGNWISSSSPHLQLSKTRSIGDKNGGK